MHRKSATKTRKPTHVPVENHKIKVSNAARRKDVEADKSIKNEEKSISFPLELSTSACSSSTASNLNSADSSHENTGLVHAVMRYVGYKSIPLLLKFRGLTRTWTYHVDDFLIEQCSSAYWHPYLDENPPEDSLKRVFGKTFKTVQDVEKFMSDMSNHNGYPFPNRGIKIWNSFNWRFLQKLKPLVIKFGERISYCTYGGGGVDTVKLLKTILQRLPNLINLRLINLNRPDKDIRDNKVTRGTEWLKDPLPPMDNLVCLSAIQCYDDYILNAILIAYGDQLECLECEGSIVRKCAYFNGGDINAIPNVKKLKIIGVDEATLNRIPETIQLTHLSLLQLKKKDDWRNFSYTTATEAINLRTKVFKFVHTYRLSLIELHLHTTSWFRGSIVTLEANDSLPMITKFGVSCDIPSALDMEHITWKIFKNFTNLQHLVLYDWNNTAVFVNSRLQVENRQVNGYEFQPYSYQNFYQRLDHSQAKFACKSLRVIWRKIPTLKKITLLYKHSERQILYVASRPQETANEGIGPDS